MGDTVIISEDRLSLTPHLLAPTSVLSPSTPSQLTVPNSTKSLKNALFQWQSKEYPIPSPPPRDRLSPTESLRLLLIT